MTATGNSPATAYVTQQPGNGTTTLLPVRTATLDAALYRIWAGGQLQKEAALDVLLDGCEWDNLVAQPRETWREA